MIKPEIVLKLKEQFKAEMNAYTAYEMLLEHIDDDYLECALKEIMYDEYLHAKFLRSYMIEEGLYDPNQHLECEKIYNKIIENE